MTMRGLRAIVVDGVVHIWERNSKGRIIVTKMPPALQPSLMKRLIREQHEHERSIGMRPSIEKEQEIIRRRKQELEEEDA